jgi:microcystin-dependent protein
MASSWPAAYDYSFPGYPYVNSTEYVLAAYANSWVQAIQALETGIGYGTGSVAANPLYSVAYNQSFATITARIANVESSAASGVVINSNSNNIQSVGSVNQAGSNGSAADAGHTHKGVTSFGSPPRYGAITLTGGDFGGMFTASGGLIAGTGNGTSEILPVGATGSHLTVGGADPSGLQWQAAEWVSGDYKFSAATSMGNLWILANGSAVSRTSQSSLFNAVTLSFSGTASGTTITGISSSITSLIVSGVVGLNYIIEGPGLGTSSYITGVGATSITVSNAPTAGAGAFRVFLQGGNGDGSSTFNVPDMRGRMPVGAFGPGTNSQPLVGMGSTLWDGGIPGEAEHSLSVGENATHAHTDTGHTHPVAGQSGGFQPVIGQEGFTGTWAAAANGSQYGPTGLGLNTDAVLNTGTGNAQIASSGSGSAHNNMPPFVGGQWWIHI